MIRTQQLTFGFEDVDGNQIPLFRITKVEKYTQLNSSKSDFLKKLIKEIKQAEAEDFGNGQK